MSSALETAFLLPPTLLSLPGCRLLAVTPHTRSGRCPPPSQAAAAAVADFSQQDTPCLIIEDSQPESQVLEDDSGSHFSVLARHLPNLQTHKENPGLFLYISNRNLTWKEEMTTYTNILA